jgi:hypothetical protein
MLETLKLPRLILDLFGVQAAEADRHVWEVRVKLLTLPDGRFQRAVQVWHQGEQVDESVSRAWRP